MIKEINGEGSDLCLPARMCTSVYKAEPSGFASLQSEPQPTCRINLAHPHLGETICCLAARVIVYKTARLLRLNILNNVETENILILWHGLLSARPCSAEICGWAAAVWCKLCPAEGFIITERVFYENSAVCQQNAMWLRDVNVLWFTW